MILPYDNYIILTIFFQLLKCRKFELILVQFTIKNSKNILLVYFTVNVFAYMCNNNIFSYSLETQKLYEMCFFTIKKAVHSDRSVFLLVAEHLEDVVKVVILI